MKYLFFLLLLCNIVFYFWEIGVRGGDSAIPPARPDRQGAPLHLIKELAETPRKKLPPVAASAAKLPENAAVPADAPPTAPPGERPSVAATAALPAEPTPDAMTESPPAPSPGESAPAARTAEGTAAEAAPPPAAPEAERATADAPTSTPAAPETPETPETNGVRPAQTAEAPPASAARETPDPSSDAACYLHGPYRSQRQAQVALNALQSKPERSAVVSRPSDIPEAYMILYPKAETAEAAQANRKTLAAQGVPDAWVIDKGEYRNAISLAVFRNKNHADEALRRFQEKGVPAEIAPRFGKSLTWWLQISWNGERAELETLLGKTRPEASLRDCETSPPR